MRTAAAHVFTVQFRASTLLANAQQRSVVSTTLAVLLAAAHLAVGLAQAAPLSAQVRIGDRVRVTARDNGIRQRVGTMVALNADTLAIETAPPGDTVRLAVASITTVEVERARRSRALLAGAVGLAGGAEAGLLFSFVAMSGPGIEALAAGAFFGSTLGAAIGAGGKGVLTYSGLGLLAGAAAGAIYGERIECDELEQSCIAAGAAILGGAGLWTGTLVGAIAGVGRWQGVPLGHLRVSQSHGRLGVGFSMRW